MIKQVKITRSFGFKLYVGNFESRNFLCSQEAECDPAKVDAIGEQLYESCKRQVFKSVKSYKAEQKAKAQARREKMLDE